MPFLKAYQSLRDGRLPTTIATSLDDTRNFSGCAMTRAILVMTLLIWNVITQFENKFTLKILFIDIIGLSANNSVLPAWRTPWHMPRFWLYTDIPFISIISIYSLEMQMPLSNVKQWATAKVITGFISWKRRYYTHYHAWRYKMLHAEKQSSALDEIYVMLSDTTELQQVRRKLQELN